MTIFAMPYPASRYIGVDALRGLAAIAVCLFHWEYIAFKTPNADEIFYFGLFGVELFFTISGFVILMVAERTRSIREFVIARALRLYPAYLASVALTACFVLKVGRYKLIDVLINATMFQSFLDVPNITNPYWTLAFEISFYGILIVVLHGRLLHRIETIGLAWLGLALLYRVCFPNAMSLMPGRPLAQIAFIVVAPQFAPFFIIGMMVFRFRQGMLGRTGRIAIVVALSLTLLGRGDFAKISGPAYAALSLSMAVALCVASSISSSRFLAPLAWLGLISYPLYLVHCTLANLAKLIAPVLGLTEPQAVCLSAPASVAIAAAIHYGLERPITGLFRGSGHAKVAVQAERTQMASAG